MYTIFVDTDLDITPSIASKYGFKMISMPYIINDKVYYPYKDSDTIDFDKFYNLLRSGVVPKTSSINIGEYIEYFEPELQKGNDILYIHFSSSMSGTFKIMDMAIKELKEKYPDRRIETIDTLSITIGGLSIVEDIGDHYLSGEYDLDQLIAYAKTIIQHYTVYFFATDLKFFKKSGRISNFAGFMGDLIGLKPIIYIDKTGKMVTIDKARGIKQVISKIFDYIKKVQLDIEKYRIIVTHSGAENEVELVKRKLKEKYGENLNIQLMYVNPTIASHCGPNCLGISFHCKRR